MKPLLLSHIIIWRALNVKSNSKRDGYDCASFLEVTLSSCSFRQQPWTVRLALVKLCLEHLKSFMLTFRFFVLITLNYFFIMPINISVSIADVDLSCTWWTAFHKFSFSTQHYSELLSMKKKTACNGNSIREAILGRSRQWLRCDFFVLCPSVMCHSRL